MHFAVVAARGTADELLAALSGRRGTFTGGAALGSGSAPSSIAVGQPQIWPAGARAAVSVDCGLNDSELDAPDSRSNCM